jgi:cyclic pyranopterin phosphate synthase
LSALTHFDSKGNAIMVDVGNKPTTARKAVAEGVIQVSPQVMDAILRGRAAKGDVLGVARVAGIMAAKRTSDLIPLCHPLPIDKCSIEFFPQEERGCVKVQCTVHTESRTGVEMEALTGVGVALLTVYDMCKALDKSMIISDIRLLQKDGGKSGAYRAPEQFDQSEA